MITWPNQITRANAGKRPGFAVKSRVVLRHRPGVAQFHRWPLDHTMRTFEALKWLNKRGAPLAVLALLLAFGSFTHRMAIARLNMTDWRLLGMDARAESRVRFVGYVDTHLWVAVLFAALFAVSLVWLQFRQSPRWSLWLTFALLVLPVLGYAWVCLRVETAPMIWRR